MSGECISDILSYIPIAMGISVTIGAAFFCLLMATAEKSEL